MAGTISGRMTTETASAVAAAMGTSIQTMATHYAPARRRQLMQHGVMSQIGVEGTPGPAAAASVAATSATQPPPMRPPPPHIAAARAQLPHASVKASSTPTPAHSANVQFGKASGMAGAPPFPIQIKREGGAPAGAASALETLVRNPTSSAVPPTSRPVTAPPSRPATAAGFASSTLVPPSFLAAARRPPTAPPSSVHPPPPTTAALNTFVRPNVAASHAMAPPPLPPQPVAKPQSQVAYSTVPWRPQPVASQPVVRPQPGAGSASTPGPTQPLPYNTVAHNASGLMVVPYNHLAGYNWMVGQGPTAAQGLSNVQAGPGSSSAPTSAQTRVLIIGPPTVGAPSQWAQQVGGGQPVVGPARLVVAGMQGASVGAQLQPQPPAVNTAACDAQGVDKPT